MQADPPYYAKLEGDTNPAALDPEASIKAADERRTRILAEVRQAYDKRPHNHENPGRRRMADDCAGIYVKRMPSASRPSPKVDSPGQCRATYGHMAWSRHQAEEAP